MAADDGAIVDLLLGEGEAAERQALREAIGRDPLRTLEMAETVALFEGLRELRTEPSPLYGCRLHDVVRRAERAAPAAPRPHWLVGVAWAAAAAAVVFALLWSWDPLGRRAPARRGDPVAVPSVPRSRGPVATNPTADREAEAWRLASEQMRQRLSREPSPRLGEAFELALVPPADPIERWLDPHNALASLRADHEQRGRAEFRLAALQHQGGLAAVDARVQELTGRVADELVRLRGGFVPAEAADVALGVRALIAAGTVDPAREDALAVAATWLEVRLPHCTGASLVAALTALVEVAAVSDRGGDLVAQHGRRLVDEVLRADADTWGRRRPELLAGGVATAVLGDAARVLRLLPGFGVDAARCLAVRQLVLGRLREQRDAGDDGPEVPTAMLYGCSDLLAAAERDEIERQLHRWTPLRLAPDFVTVQQYAWGFEPGRIGFARLQLALRRLAVLPDPGRLAARAAYSLCLAAPYAAWPSAAAHLAAGD
ncbi:MAG: hypothetical protein JNL08_18935 [Planctomycetes bacterium]|nr:hypothetical protein [Planctomycetota bacterium]